MPSVAASPSPSPTGAGFALGDPAQADNGQVQATVFDYKQPIAPDVPTSAPGGNVWGAADVQVCVAATAIFDVSVSKTPWQLYSPDAPPATPALIADSRFPQPGYPADHRRLHAGQCVRGWIVFTVGTGVRPTVIKYAPTGATPVSWNLP